MGLLFAEFRMWIFLYCFYYEELIQFVPVSSDLQTQCPKMTGFYGAGVAPPLHTARGGRVFYRAERPVPPLMSHPAYSCDHNCCIDDTDIVL